jgi:hypothetical protein
MPLNGLQMPATPFSHHAMMDCMANEMWAGGTHHVNSLKNQVYERCRYHHYQFRYHHRYPYQCRYRYHD